jgi:hypothetical protein
MTLAEKSVRIQNLIHQHAARLQFRRKAAIGFAAIGTSLLALFGIIMLEWWLWMPPTIRVPLLTGTLVLGGWVFYKVRLSLKATRFGTFYRNVSAHANLPELRYALDLSLAGSEYRPGLYQSALEANFKTLEPQQVRDACDAYVRKHPTTERYQAASLTLITGTILIALFSVFQSEATMRVLTPLTTYFQPNPFTFTISPGNETLEQGTPQTFSVQFNGRTPNSVRLALKTDAEGDYRILPMEVGDTRSFHSAAISLFDDVSYYLLMDAFRTDEYRLYVQLLPRFSQFEAEVVPPAYTRLESTLWQYPFSQLEAYPGSEITLRAQINTPDTRIQLHRRSQETPQELLATSDGQISSSLDILAPDSIWFSMVDPAGLQNRNTFAFEIATLTDTYPEIRILSPEASLSLLEPGSIDILYEARDDFGFTAVRLMYEIKRSFGSAAPESGTLRGNPPSSRADIGSIRWDLATLRLLPMDEVRYWLEITDNDRPGGFKSTRSGTQTLRIASLTDMLLAQEEREQSLGDRLEEFQQTYEENRRALENLREQIQRNEGENWEQSRAAEQLLEQRQELDEQLNTIREQFDQLTQDLNETDRISEETKQMYEDLKQLMDEIDDPRIREALEQLRQGLENFDQNMVRDALQELNFNEDRYRERLERTLDLFKSLQVNAELDRMSAMLEDLAKQEDSLIGENLPDTEEQSQRQESIRNQLQQMQERLNSLPEKGPNRTREQLENLQNSLNEDISAVDEQLREDIQDMSEGGSGEDSPAQERREKVRDQLNEMQQRTKSAKAMMGQQGVQVNRRALLGIMQNLLLLSGAQESLIQTTSELSQGSAGFIAQAREQRSIARAFSQITDSLYQVSREVPQFPNRLNLRKAEVQQNLDNATRLLAERDRNRSVAEERIALGGMNEISSMLADLLDALNNSDDSGGGGGGMSPEQMLEQLQQMSGQQQQLNQQIQDMINDMAGERLMQDQMERLDQMARQQNEIRRQLRDLQQRGGLQPGDELLSDLQRLSEAMEDAINDLRGGVTDERVIVQRQQNILTRMLRAEQALNEREQDEQRRGDRPQDPLRGSPPELTLEQLREQVRRSLQDPNQTRFSPEYQRLIERYFELLEESERLRP